MATCLVTRLVTRLVTNMAGSTGIYWDLLGSTGIYWALLGSTIPLTDYEKKEAVKETLAQSGRIGQELMEVEGAVEAGTDFRFSGRHVQAAGCFISAPATQAEGMADGEADGAADGAVDGAADEEIAEAAGGQLSPLAAPTEAGGLPAVGAAVLPPGFSLTKPGTLSMAAASNQPQFDASHKTGPTLDKLASDQQAPAPRPSCACCLVSVRPEMRQLFCAAGGRGGKGLATRSEEATQRLHDLCFGDARGGQGGKSQYFGQRPRKDPRRDLVGTVGCRQSPVAGKGKRAEGAVRCAD